MRALATSGCNVNFLIGTCFVEGGLEVVIEIGECLVDTVEVSVTSCGACVSVMCAWCMCVCV